MLKIGDSIKVNKTEGTGLIVGKVYKVTKVNIQEPADPHYTRNGGVTYSLDDDGYAMCQSWLLDGRVEFVKPTPLPRFEVGDLVRIPKTKYSSINDKGKLGIVTRKCWFKGGIEMYEVVVQGKAASGSNWAYSNEQIEFA